MLLQNLHAAVKTACCHRNCMLLQNLHDAAKPACYCRRCMMLQKMHDAAKTACCCRSQLHAAAETACCCRSKLQVAAETACRCRSERKAEQLPPVGMRPLGRTMLQKQHDNHFPRKAVEVRIGDARRCISVMQRFRKREGQKGYVS